MKFGTIINRYIFKEMIMPFVIIIIFFTFVFLMTKILDITNLVVNYKISLSVVLLLLIYFVPGFLIFVIPISIMLTVLVTFLRLASDNEIIAFKAGGVSLYQLLRPVFWFCLIGCILTGFMTIYGLPWGRLSFKEMTFKLVTSHANIGLKERTFNDSFKGVMLYANKIDLKNNTLIDVFIEDQRAKEIVSVVISPRGELFCEPEKLLFTMRLYNGIINQVDIKHKSVHSIKFETYNVNLDLNRTVSAAKIRPKDENEMSLVELSKYINNADLKNDKYYDALIEFHKKFSIPFACFPFGLLAVSLGAGFKYTKRSYGLGLGLVFILFYYLLMSAGIVFGEAGFYPPIIGMWAPNIAIGVIGIFFVVKTANEHPLTIRPLKYLKSALTK